MLVFDNSIHDLSELQNRIKKIIRSNLSGTNSSHSIRVTYRDSHSYHLVHIYMMKPGKLAILNLPGTMAIFSTSILLTIACILNTHFPYGILQKIAILLFLSGFSILLIDFLSSFFYLKRKLVLKK